MLWEQTFHALAEKCDAVLFHEIWQVDGDLLWLTPANGNPRVRGCELEAFRITDQDNLVLLAQFFPEFVGLRDATDAGAHYHDLRHFQSPQLKFENQYMAKH